MFFSRFASRVSPRALMTLGFAGSLSLASYQSLCAETDMNSAFLFIKPHACKGTPGAVEDLVKDRLAEAGITVEAEGSYDAEVIDEKQFIDNHYGAIASKAVVLKPTQLNVPAKGQAKFQKMFGISWDDALAQGLVYNAKDGATFLGVDGAGLEQKWRGLTRGKDLIKFGGGFYCGKVDGVFIMNGFYMSMREAYCKPGEKIQWMTVSWPAADLSWEDFRGTVLGSTNPATAPTGSIRREILDNYEDLGLTTKPDTGNNGVHASASPLEAFCERKNWLGVATSNDSFAQACLEECGHVDEFVLNEFCNDPQVSYMGGSPGSLFDLVEDQNTAEVLSMLRKTQSVESYNLQQAKLAAAASAAEESQQLINTACARLIEQAQRQAAAGNIAESNALNKKAKQAYEDFAALVQTQTPVFSSEPTSFFPAFFESLSSRLSSDAIDECAAYSKMIGAAKMKANEADDDDDDY